MTQAIKATYSLVDTYRKYISLTLLSLSMVMAFIYAFNVYSIVNKTISTEHILAKASVLDNEAQKMDIEYISLSSKLTPDDAKKYGLQETKDITYIEKTHSLGSIVRANEL